MSAETPWGVDSEYGRLLDVLLCPPDNFRWLPTSAISRATLDSGRSFDPAQARSQHAEMASAYEDAGGRPPGGGMAREGRLGGANRAHPAALRPHRRAHVHARRAAGGCMRRRRLVLARHVARAEEGRDRARLAEGRLRARRQRGLPRRRPRPLDLVLQRAERAAARARDHGARSRPLVVHARRRRRPLPDAGAAARARGLMREVEPGRVIADLRELDRRTGGPGGARRVCWTDEWESARAF